MSEILPYPFFKLTRERFPRLLITRKTVRDGSEYFGPFLPEPGARKLLDFVITRFRLRGCEVRVDGTEQIPCPVYYERRCLAPCVAEMCGEESYREMVALLRLFLARDKREFRTAVSKKIALASEKFDFEDAARWRDLLTDVEKVWTLKKWNLWIDDATDNWTWRDGRLYLVSQRANRILGGRSAESSHGEAPALISSFYKMHAPGRIRMEGVGIDPAGLSTALARKNGNEVTVELLDDATFTASKGIARMEYEVAFEEHRRPGDHRYAIRELKRELGLKRLPKEILAFDAAHSSGTHCVAAKVVWKNGDFRASDDEVWRFPGSAEPDAIGKAVSISVENGEDPDLILVDGGISQLKAAADALARAGSGAALIAAVKPPGRPREISHFLDTDGERIELKDESAKGLLTTLRDSAHGLANRVHRISRDTSQLYELARTLPGFEEGERREILKKMGSLRRLRSASQDELAAAFGKPTAGKIRSALKRGNVDPESGNTDDVISRLVPIRYDAPGGEAERLQPKNNYRL